MAASILTNSSAMVALATLRNTNKQVETVTAQVSTGKRIGEAKDNSAVFAISAVMTSDVTGFKALGESLALGSATLAVAANAAKSIGGLLNEIKGKIVTSNEENVDRVKIDNEINSLVGQITSIVNAAQFNGLNLIDGSTATDFSVLSSLDRAADQSVVTSQITVNTTGLTNLSTTAGTDLLAGGAVTTTAGATVPGFSAGGNTFDVVIAGVQEDATTPLGALGRTATGADATDDTALLAGDLVEVIIGQTRAGYQVREGDETADVAAGLRAALVDAGIDQDAFTLDASTAAGTLTVTNNSEVDTPVTIRATRGGGGLSALQTIDVTTAGGATNALASIEGLIQTSINAQAEIGTGQKRLELQSEFMKSLVDAFNSGIGALVDADLEEASARLQALQVQQQLGIQALSIANQQPQNILALFR